MDSELIKSYMEISFSLSFESAWRIVEKKHIMNPLGTGKSKSKFSILNGEFKVLYLALNYETALIEVFVIDWYDDGATRQISSQAIKEYAGVAIKSTRSLILLNLTDGNASKVGISSKVRHDTDYNSSRELSALVYNHLPMVDGFFTDHD